VGFVSTPSWRRRPIARTAYDTGASVKSARADQTAASVRCCFWKANFRQWAASRDRIIGKDRIVHVRASASARYVFVVEHGSWVGQQASHSVASAGRSFIPQGSRASRVEAKKRQMRVWARGYWRARKQKPPASSPPAPALRPRRVSALMLLQNTISSEAPTQFLPEKKIYKARALGGTRSITFVDQTQRRVAFRATPA